MKMRIAVNELDKVFVFNILVGFFMLFIGIFYDVIANKLLLQHNSSEAPLLQIFWCVFWLFYIWIQLYYQYFYGE